MSLRAAGWPGDIVAMGLLIIACCAMLAPAWRELPAGSGLVACAVLIRPTYLSVLAGLLILEAVPRNWIAQPRRHTRAADDTRALRWSCWRRCLCWRWAIWMTGISNRCCSIAGLLRQPPWS